MSELFYLVYVQLHLEAINSFQLLTFIRVFARVAFVMTVFMFLKFWGHYSQFFLFQMLAYNI